LIGPRRGSAEEMGANGPLRAQPDRDFEREKSSGQAAGAVHDSDGLSGPGSQAGGRSRGTVKHPIRDGNWPATKLRGRDLTRFYSENWPFSPRDAFVARLADVGQKKPVRQSLSAAKGFSGPGNLNFSPNSIRGFYCEGKNSRAKGIPHLGPRPAHRLVENLLICKKEFFCRAGPAASGTLDNWVGLIRWGGSSQTALTGPDRWASIGESGGVWRDAAASGKKSGGGQAIDGEQIGGRGLVVGARRWGRARRNLARSEGRTFGGKTGAFCREVSEGAKGLERGCFRAKRGGRRLDSSRKIGKHGSGPAPPGGGRKAIAVPKKGRFSRPIRDRWAHRGGGGGDRATRHNAGESNLQATGGPPTRRKKKKF